MARRTASSAVAAGQQQLAEDACATMQSLLETLQGRPDPSAPPPSRQLLVATSQCLRTEAAKVGLMFNAPEPPSAADSEALLRSLQNAAGGACMVLMGAAGRGGPTLRQSVHSAAQRLVSACQELVRGAVLEHARGEALMHLVGRCLEQCDAVAKAPLDNKTAIGRAITQVLKTLADASRELQDVATEAEASEAAGGAEQPLANGTAAIAAPGQENGFHGHEEGLSDEDADLACEALSAQQAEVVRSVHAMLGAVSALLKAVVRALLGAGAALDGDGSESSRSAPGASAALEEWEGLLFHVRALATSTEDLAAAIYPPQDRDELESAAEAVVNGCELICEETPVELAEGEEAPPSASGGAAGADAGRRSEPEHVSGLAAELEGVEGAHRRLAAALEELGD